MLRDHHGFTMPIACGGIDYPMRGVIQLVYYISNPKRGVLLLFRFEVSRVAPEARSLTSVWPAMDFHEREAHEMFGVKFLGHRNMIPFLLPPDWRGGYPLRKDFKGEGAR